MGFYFFPGLPLFALVRLGFCSWLVTGCTTEVPDRHHSKPHLGWPCLFQREGVWLWVWPRCVVTWSPIPLQFPKTPLQSLPSPPLWEPLLPFASWTFSGDPRLLADGWGCLSAWDASCSQEVLSPLRVCFFLLVVRNGCFFTSFKTKIVCHDCSFYPFQEKTGLYLTYICHQGIKVPVSPLAPCWCPVILLYTL